MISNCERDWKHVDGHTMRLDIILGASKAYKKKYNYPYQNPQYKAGGPCLGKYMNQTVLRSTIWQITNTPLTF